jgi:hypothetical protein
MSWIRIVSMALLPIMVGGCGTEPETADEGRDAPWGLETIDLPDSRASVRAVLEEMPEEIAGLSRLEVLRDEVHYEGGARLGVTRLGGDYLPIRTVAELARLLSEGGEVEVEEEQLDEDGPLVYQLATTTGNGRQVYTMLRGAPRSQWAFTTVTNSPEARQALVEAFVEASKTRER